MKGSKVKIISLSGQAPDAILHKAVNTVLEEEAAKTKLQDSTLLHPVNPRTKPVKAKIKRKISKESRQKNR